MENGNAHSNNSENASSNLKPRSVSQVGLGRQKARVVAFLASPAGSWVNGAMIAVDGAQQQPAMFHKGPL